MLILKHKNQLVEACYPKDDEERKKLWADIKPVKFGQTVLWLAATQYALARYQVPDEAAYNIVCRVETYVVNLTAGAVDYGMIEPPPPGFAFWQYVPYGTGATYTLTSPGAPVQRLLDADEFLIFKGGYNLTLIGDFTASPDGITRNVRTLVYSYNVGTMVADRLGVGEVEIVFE